MRPRKRGVGGSVPQVIDVASTRDLSPEVMLDQGRPRIMPADYYRRATKPELGLLCHKHGVYGLPTIELVTWLKRYIAGRSAIEIGAGNGMMATAVGIRATDSFQQTRPEIQAYYDFFKQPPVIYGPHVENIDAAAAVRKYLPDVVLGCWVTHKYREERHTAGGNAWGIDEEDVLAHCAEYILIGNTVTHAGKSIWDRKHKIAYPNWIFSRAQSEGRDFIAIFKGDKNRDEG